MIRLQKQFNSNDLIQMNAELGDLSYPLVLNRCVAGDVPESLCVLLEPVAEAFYTRSTIHGGRYANEA